MKPQSNKRYHILSGIALFILIALLLPRHVFPREAAIALATLVLMVYWWIARPVHLAVTALLPIVVTSLFGIVKINTVLDDYFGPVTVLLIGANVLTLTWTLWKLDKRVSLRFLTILGTSVKTHLIVWFILATALSTVLPNAVVAATLCPIAIAMMHHSGYLGEDGDGRNVRYWILLAIVWGAGIGGFGTPLGGAMNLVTITHLENYLGGEYMYVTWSAQMLPYLLVLAAVTIGYMMTIKTDMRHLSGSRDYFKTAYKDLGPMNRSEIIAVILFSTALILSFTRPLYASLLPDFKPPFAFLLLGLIAFFLKGSAGKPLITWDYAAKNINWGLIILFSGGIALGNLLVGTGAAKAIADLLVSIHAGGPLGWLTVFVVLGVFLSNTSSNTAACAVLIPVVFSITQQLGCNPLPYVYVSAAACNAAYILPTSIRAIPVAYGLDAPVMLKKGLMANAIALLALIASGYVMVLIG